MQTAEYKTQSTETSAKEENNPESVSTVDETEAEENIISPDTPIREQKSGKAHLTSSVPRTARVPGGTLTKGEMAEIREIFGDIDDAEIQRLYKRVTK